MHLIQYCITAVLLTTVSCAVIDVEKTVKQVQSILQSNSQLPRLTRSEILDLLNDIRAEDSKSTSASKENLIELSTKPYSIKDNEISTATEPQVVKKAVIINNNKDSPAATSPPHIESTTKKTESTVMVVLPYTSRDGSSLQELYTRPPRVEVVPEADVTTKTNLDTQKIRKSLTDNAKLAEKSKKEDFPAELQAFLDAHGLKGKPGQDHFLLPLEGFKPLPPAKIVDGTVQLPENILLTYDLISPSDSKWNNNNGVSAMPPNNFLYEPLRPEYPFELDTSSSETKETIYPLDIPKSRKPKSAEAQNYEPIDYDAVKVIPLDKGVSPVEEGIVTDSDQSKRQTNETNTETTTVTEEVKSAPTESPTASDSSASADDNGASIADLEDSFGGAAPDVPGDSDLPPPRKNGFYWMLDWNSFLEVGDGDTKVNIRFEPKLGDPQMFLPVSVP